MLKKLLYRQHIAIWKRTQNQEKPHMAEVNLQRSYFAVNVFGEWLDLKVRINGAGSDLKELLFSEASPWLSGSNGEVS